MKCITILCKCTHTSKQIDVNAKLIGCHRRCVLVLVSNLKVKVNVSMDVPHLSWVEWLQTGERKNSSKAFLECLHLTCHTSYQRPVHHQLLGQEGEGQREGEGLVMHCHTPHNTPSDTHPSCEYLLSRPFLLAVWIEHYITVIHSMLLHVFIARAAIYRALLLVLL